MCLDFTPKCNWTNFRLFLKPKKLITEEKMAEHLQGLHISPDFTSHSTPTLEDYSNDSVSTSDSIMESDSSSSSTDCPFTITSTQDLEQKLRNAQRITICEEIRKLQNEPVIPQVQVFSILTPRTVSDFRFLFSNSQAILSRFERPSTALVLWQPPAKITELCASQRERKERDDDEQDNNNSSSVDFNNAMDLDL